MFKKSVDATQQDMFNSIPSMLKGNASKQYNDMKAWHNMFRSEVVERVDELVFKSLYDDTMGAPNASTRILIGMFALKEGFGWSDSELFEQSRFNLLVRSALGLFNINESIPTESTYYLFRKNIYNYQRTHGVDLIEKVFQQITRGQILDYKVNGRSIRMDSKLIGSNIAWCSRYEIVHNTIVLFCKEMKEKSIHKLKMEVRNQIKEITEIESRKIVHRSSREEVEEKLKSLGLLIYDLLSISKERDNPYFQILKRVYDEQYKFINCKVELRPKQEIKSDSIQSPHDPDCTYRNKDEQQIKGYSTNVTETCDDEGLNLIVDVQLSPAMISDHEFFQPAINNAEEILNHKPENTHADGAYQSPENVKYCEGNDINHYFTGMQGAPGRYDLMESDGELIVTDRLTGLIMPVGKTKKGRWSIKTDEGKYRYFSQKEIEACKLREKIASMPIEKRHKRNNVEATIFQLSYHTRKNKTRYRGLIQNKMWATMRCTWINLRRIMLYMEPICQRTQTINIFDRKNAAICLESLNFFLNELFIVLENSLSGKFYNLSMKCSF